MDARHTAAAIARVRRAEGNHPPGKRLFEDPYAQLFDDPRTEVQAVFDLMPFFVEHIRIRTRFFDDEIREAVARGTRQVVLVGAGFDTRALRMPELAGIHVVEVDHADQIANKKLRFEAAGVTLPPTVSFAAADLGEDGGLARALPSAGVTKPSDTLWICEGLFGYLSMPTIAALARDVARFSTPGSRLVANHHAYVWTTAALVETFTRAGFHAEGGPSLTELHLKWIGYDVPPGGEEFALFLAARN